MIAEQLKVAFKQSYDLHIYHHGSEPAMVIMHNDTAAMLGSECNYLNFDKDSKNYYQGVLVWSTKYAEQNEFVFLTQVEREILEEYTLKHQQGKINQIERKWSSGGNVEFFVNMASTKIIKVDEIIKKEIIEALENFSSSFKKQLIKAKTDTFTIKGMITEPTNRYSL